MPETSPELTMNVSEELILTPFTGASLVNEILKLLLFQKSQIPYGFSRLKQVVEKRRKSINSLENQPKKIPNFKYENHFRIVSAAYDCLDSLMQAINKEFCEEHNIVQEIMLVFGSSPVCPKEVFSLVIPSLAKGHVERNHLNQINKQMRTVLRNLFHSQIWMDSIDATIPLTNTYFYLKKQTSTNSNFTSETFELCQPLHISSHIKHSKCILSYVESEIESERTNCCANLAIFDDGSKSSETPKEPEGAEMEKRVVWCRAKETLKGFKDCYENKTSISEMW